MPGMALQVLLVVGSCGSGSFTPSAALLRTCLRYALQPRFPLTYRSGPWGGALLNTLSPVAREPSVSSLRESVVNEFIAIALAMPQHALHVLTAVPSGHAGAKERRPGSHHSIGNSTSNAIPNGLTMHSPERLGEI